jgi:hypothetical protein
MTSFWCWLMPGGIELRGSAGVLTMPVVGGENVPADNGQRRTAGCRCSGTPVA